MDFVLWGIFVFKTKTVIHDAGEPSALASRRCIGKGRARRFLGQTKKPSNSNLVLSAGWIGDAAHCHWACWIRGCLARQPFDLHTSLSHLILCGFVSHSTVSHSAASRFGDLKLLLCDLVYHGERTSSSMPVQSDAGSLCSSVADAKNSGQLERSPALHEAPQNASKPQMSKQI